MNEWNVVGLAKQADDLLSLAEAHEAMVHEDAGELLADGFMDEDGGHRAADPAREPADHLLEADLLLDAVNGLFLEGSHGPVAVAAANIDDKVFQKPGA